MSNHLLELSNINKSFYTEEVETRALFDINLTIDKGEYVSLMGPSGSGKSTLLSILGLLDNATSGTYKLSGIDVTDMSRDQRARVRNKEIGFIFQSFNLISELSVEENIMLPLVYQEGHSKAEMQRMAKEVLQKVNMEHRLKHFPAQLSGGQQQRVAIARSLVNSPSLILADEPTGNLDSENAAAVMQILDSLHKEGATICMVTHDPRSAKQVNRMIEIFDGKVRKTSEQTAPQADSNPVEEAAIA